jgi:GTP cyclohydrolase II
MANDNNTINGDPVALLIDRAVGELRRGRAVEITAQDQAFRTAAVEAMSPALLSRLATRSPEPLMLVLTEQRAAALGLTAPPGSPGPCVVRVAKEWSLEQLRAIAGVGAGIDADIDSDTVLAVAKVPAPELAAMRSALQLTKSGRLVPALAWLGAVPGNDVSLLQIPASQIAPYATFLRQRLRRVSHARVPLAESLNTEIVLFRDEHLLGEHVAVIIGRIQERAIVPVRLHSACLTGDLLGSLRCDCGEQLRAAVARIAELGGGILLYLDQEGRGIGLANKLRAYALQDAGLDTLDADRHLGFLADERSYDVAALLLKELGIERVELLTNNPRKIAALKEHGIDVAGRMPLVGTTNEHNERYIRAKRDRAGHLDLAEDASN